MFRRLLAAAGSVLAVLVVPVEANATLRWSAPITIDHGRFLPDVACPAENQCTVVDTYGQGPSIEGREATFDPAWPGSPVFHSIGSVGMTPTRPGELDGLDCHLVSQCVAVDSAGREVTFAPGDPDAATSADVGRGLNGVACPSVSQCTAVGQVGPPSYSSDVVTFDPTLPSHAVVDFPADAIRVACPSTNQCTTVTQGNNGEETTFDPWTPGQTETTLIVPGLTSFGGLACPAPRQCTAVDAEGRATTFDPLHPSPAKIALVDPGHAMDGVACPSTATCVAIDDGGRAIAGVPGAGSWMAIPIDSVGRLTSIACSSASECVVTDDQGDVVVGTAPPSRAEIRTALVSVMAAAERLRSVAGGLANGGWMVRITLPWSGRLTLAWTWVRKHGRPIVIGQATVENQAGRRTRLLIRLTRQGRGLLRQAIHGLCLMDRVTFTSTNRARVAVARRFRLSQC